MVELSFIEIIQENALLLMIFFMLGVMSCLICIVVGDLIAFIVRGRK
jgi:hypothetical protein